MHLFDWKMGILTSKSGCIFKPMPKVAEFYLGPTPDYVSIPFASIRLGLGLAELSNKEYAQRTI